MIDCINIEGPRQRHEHRLVYCYRLFLYGAPMIERMTSRAERNKIIGAISAALIDLNDVVQIESQNASARWHRTAVARFSKNGHFMMKRYGLPFGSMRAGGVFRHAQVLVPLWNYHA